MNRTIVLLIVVICFVGGISGAALAKPGYANGAPYNPRMWLPPDILAMLPAQQFSATAVDTFFLHAQNFNSGSAAGYTTVDITAQLATFFHVDDGIVMNGGTWGNLAPLVGNQSMWCGRAASGTAPYCGYATLPGYGNNWVQLLCSDPASGDSISISYKTFFDTEPGYDGTVVEYTFDSGGTWTAFAVTDTQSVRASTYEGTAAMPFITEGPFKVGGAVGASNVQVRFRFTSSDSWSDEDGLYPSDGAIILDDIMLHVWNGGTPVVNDLEDFESASVGDNEAGIWTAKAGASYGDFAALYPGVSVLQEDVCVFNPLYLWGFFDTATNNPYTCHLPSPAPGQGTVAFGTPNGFYLNNEIWTPPITNSGSGNMYRFTFDVYKDLPLGNLVFFTWRVRTWTSGCPSPWRNRDLVYYGKHKYWGSALQENGGPTAFVEQIGDLVDPSADEIQLAIGAVDMCGLWCGVFGLGTCHSHAPLIDEIHLERIDVSCPQIHVRHRDLFQDTFADDGTLTGTAQASAALDVIPYSSGAIQPGDSVSINIAPVGTSSGAPAAWLYARVVNSNAPKSGAGLGSPDTRAGIGVRWPHTGSFVDANSNVWECFQMDSAIVNGAYVPDRYCVDLNDALFVPGDTILYFLCADADGTPNSGNECYWTRSLNGQGVDLVTSDREAAAASPCEFTVLPAGGYNRGGDILYVDASDDRGGPAELFFDSSFDLLNIRDEVDRFDILDPTGIVNNGLESRVANRAAQIDAVYRKIIWNSGNVSNGTAGDGTGNPSKSNDYGLLSQFLDLASSGPGVYLSGDDIAQELSILSGTGAAVMRSVRIPHTLNSGSHFNLGEPLSPTLTATAGSNFTHLAVPDVLVAYGGCPIASDFDVLTKSGTTMEEFPYPTSGAGVGASAVLSRAFTNSASATATVVLSGFSFHHIRDASSGFPPARVEHLRDILNFMGNAIASPSTGVDPDGGPVYVSYLDDAYPNPFNPTTLIRYGVRQEGHVSLKIYNVAGQLVRTLVDEVQKPAAEYKQRWNGDTDAGQEVASGVYFYKLVTTDFAMTKKMVLLK